MAAQNSKEVLSQEVERRRKEARLERRYFTPPPEQKKIKELSKPLIVWQSWDVTVPAGGTAVYTVGVGKPTAVQTLWLSCMSL